MAGLELGAFVFPASCLSWSHSPLLEEILNMAFPPNHFEVACRPTIDKLRAKREARVAQAKRSLLAIAFSKQQSMQSEAYLVR